MGEEGRLDCDTFNLSAYLFICEEDTERHRQDGYNLVFSTLSKFTSPRVSLVKMRLCPPLTQQSIVTFSFVLNLRGRGSSNNVPL